MAKFSVHKIDNLTIKKRQFYTTSEKVIVDVVCVDLPKNLDKNMCASMF